MRRAPPSSPVLLIPVLLARPGTRRRARSSFNTVQPPKASTAAAPSRGITVAPDDTRYAITNDRQRHGGRVQVGRRGPDLARGRPTRSQHGAATIDVDIVADADGRIIASELDDAGLNFPTLDLRRRRQDLDRVQGRDPARRPGPPVVRRTARRQETQAVRSTCCTTTSRAARRSTTCSSRRRPTAARRSVRRSRSRCPGDDAYTDLQCADSGGPSRSPSTSTTGVIYAEFTTRAAP